MANTKELKEQVKSNFSPVKKKNQLYDKLPPEEREENEQDTGREDSRKPEIRATGEPNSRSEGQIRLAMNLPPDTYEIFDEMLAAGKRRSRTEIGLTLQQNELFALACEDFYKNIYSNKELFYRRVKDIVSKRRK